jgi:predicted RNA-binding protein with PIN domain
MREHRIERFVQKLSMTAFAVVSASAFSQQRAILSSGLRTESTALQ